MNKFILFSLLLAVMTETADAVAPTSPPETSARFYNRVTGIAAGDTAKVQTWDFRDAVIEKRSLAREVFNESDSLVSVLQEGNTLRYRIDNDTIFFIGQLNRISSVADSTGRAELKVPIAPYDLVSCEYGLCGLYGQGHRMSQIGSSSGGIDAVGKILVAPNDTITSVKRFHRHDVSTVKIHANKADTLQSYRLEQDEYRWFVNDYFSTIAELTQNRYYDGNNLLGESVTAYMLDSDGLEEEENTEELPILPKSHPNVMAVETFETVSLTIADAAQTGDEDIPVTYVVSDVLGRAIDKGENVPLHNVSINRGALNKGEYVLAVFSEGRLLLNHKFSAR